MSQNTEPAMTNFGLWSASKLNSVTSMLSSLGVRFEAYEEKWDQVILEKWFAWDPAASNPNIAYNLWIWSEDLEKVGNRITEMFPERKFDR